VSSQEPAIWPESLIPNAAFSPARAVIVAPFHRNELVNPVESCEVPATSPDRLIVLPWL
jgi:hypothetical protein